jgi:glycerol-3-phosphate dehydrogenase
MSAQDPHVHLDVAIIGGGIAGLWLINRLQQAGYHCGLFEAKALGSDQSVASQGMIHGGIKYTLGGALTGASEAIADMPDHWRQCLNGEGDVDLRGADTLCDHFYMWSSASVTSKLTTFFASKATRGRVDKVAANDRPALFRQGKFKGQLYRLVDMVLDVPSVLRTLANNVAGQTWLLPPERANWIKNDSGECELRVKTDKGHVRVTAGQFIFSAGRGNQALLRALDENTPAMQERPLQQVMVKLKQPSDDIRFYGHCLGTDKTPRLTISTHPTQDGRWVWYLGGSLAEKGAQQTEAEVIRAAQAELTHLMPWMDLSEATWASLPVSRAEPRQKNLLRPDKAFIGKAGKCSNVAVAWPTKLTLAPNLASECMGLLNTEGIKTASDKPDLSALDILEQAKVSPCPWDQADFKPFNEFFS